MSTQSFNTVSLTPGKLGLHSLEATERFVASALTFWHVSAIRSEVVRTCLAGQRKAGLLGDVPRLALRPGGRSGNYKRHLDICHGHAKGRQLYFLLPVLGHESHDLTRTVHDVPTTPVLEVLAKELRDSATGPFKREDTRENGTLPRASWDHPVVKASSTPVLPVAVYMDKFAHSRTDSVLGVWAINVMSQEHHVVALVRKRQVGVPGMVFPVPPDDPASLVPEGRELCVEGISTCLVNFVRGPVLRKHILQIGYPTEVPRLPPRWFPLGAQRPAACVGRSCTLQATRQSTVD